MPHLRFLASDAEQAESESASAALSGSAWGAVSARDSAWGAVGLSSLLSLGSCLLSAADGLPVLVEVTGSLVPASAPTPTTTLFSASFTRRLRLIAMLDELRWHTREVHQ